jgi:hypothetical protein
MGVHATSTRLSAAAPTTSAASAPGALSSAAGLFLSADTAAPNLPAGAL